MTDIALKQLSVGTFNLSLLGDDLEADDGMETAVILSLFSDARAPDGTVPPDGTGNPRGWWGDVGDQDGKELGSLLWLLWREKVLPATVSRARDYCRDALRWMIEDGIAAVVNVQAERGGMYQISVGIEIIKPTGKALRYAYLWDGQAAKVRRL